VAESALPPSAPTLETLGLARDRPLVIVDVDEVLGLFMQGFGAFIAERGYELRFERFALFQNIYRPGAVEHLDLALGHELFNEFFRTGCGEIEPAPGAVEALRRLRSRAEILILSNAPADAERLRAAWLRRHGLPHALILSSGPKGPVTAGLVAQTSGRTAFVDDLIPNLDSVAEHSPGTATFQHVADLRLRPLAPRSERHPRIDDWAELGDAIARAILSS
jgi:5' nucleotidase, deoxy (Pyrimidine), cytosolic type C protein (NT5C)